MSQRLVLVQGCRGEWLAAALRSSPNSPFACQVLLVGAEKQAYVERFADQLARVDAEFVDLEEIADRAEGRMRALVPALIGDLPRVELGGGRRLADSLATSRGNLWWLLEVAEKSPFRGALVRNLYVLALLREALEATAYDEIWIDVENRELRDTVVQGGSECPPVAFAAAAGRAGVPRGRTSWAWYWIYAAGHFLRWAAFRLLVGRTGANVTTRPRSLLFFTVFPQWWLGAFSESPTDRFFPPLPERIDDAESACFAWVNLGVSDLWRRRARLRAMAQSGRWVLAQTYVGSRAAIALLSPLAFLRIARFWRDCRKHVASSFAGFAVRSLVLRDILSSLTGRDLPRNRLLMHAAHRVSISRPGTIVYREECQPVERAVLLGSRGLATSIALRHIALDRNYLPLHFSDGEVDPARRGGDSLALPLPGAILATGEACARRPTTQGYPSDRVFLCGPARHSALVRRLAGPPTRAEMRERLGLASNELLLFVATSAAQDESEALLSSLLKVRGCLGSTPVVLRLHPAGRVRTELVAAVLEGERSIVCPDDGLYDYLASADAMVTAGSTIAFEAMALGVMPIVFEWPGVFNAFSFRDYEDACFVVRGTGDLETALRAVFARSGEAAVRRQRWPATLDLVFHDVRSDPRSQLIGALRSALDAARGAAA